MTKDFAEKVVEAHSFVKAQSKIVQPKKSQHVDFTTKQGKRIKYSYCTLSEVLDSVRKPLNDSNLAISQTMTLQDGIFGLKTIVVGTDLTSFVPLPDPVTMPAQEFGSALTYMRRYSITALLGLESEFDDDGSMAGEKTETPSNEPLKDNQAPKIESLADYVVKFGFHKGKKMSELNDGAIKSTITWAKSQKEPSGSVREFLEVAEAYQAEKQLNKDTGTTSNGFNFDEEIPF